jgi:hypothetical protein
MTFFYAMLGTAFIILKITNIIAWSWFWVLAPLWIPMALWLLLILAALVLSFIVAYIAD